MKGRGIGLALVAGVLLDPTAVGAADPEMAESRFDGGVRLDVRVPGTLVAYAAPRGADGSRSLVALLRRDPPLLEKSEPGTPALDPCPPDGAPGVPLELWRLDPSPGARGAPVKLRAGLPADALGLAARDVDGDGADELLLVRPTELELLADGAPRTVIAPDAFDLQVGAASGLGPALADGEALALVGVLGSARFYRPAAGEAAWRLAAEVPTPVRARARGTHLVAGSPVMRMIGRDRQAQPVYTSVLEGAGTQRLRTLLVRPTAPDPASVECWAKLPAPERPLERVPLLLDGEPVLLVTTIPAGKLNLFGEKLLRVFPLAPDRTRTGHAPLLAVEGRMNLWQSVTPFALDADGDGREDLVLAYWKGLSDARIVLDRYLRRADGSFASEPRTTAFDVANGHRGYVGYARLAPGAPPALVLFAGAELLLFADLPGTRKAAPNQPLYRVPLPGGIAPPAGEAEVSISLGSEGAGVAQSAAEGVPMIELIDFEADGRSEIVLRGGGAEGNPALSIVRLDAAQPATR